MPDLLALLLLFLIGCIAGAGLRRAARATRLPLRWGDQ